MANSTVAALSAASALAGTELFYADQSGDVKVTATQIKTFASASPTLVTPNIGTPSAGVLTSATGLPISTGLTGAGTGVLTALGVNVGSAGAPVLFNGAGGTPSSLTLTNATGLPVGSITGLGTGVATALAVNVGSAGAPVLFNGALGTPSAGVLTSATGLPISTGLTGAGTGVLTALGVNVGSAGAPVLFNGALGTPSSGTLTNATGLPAAGVTGTAAILGANTFTALQTITQGTANTGILTSTGFSVTGSNTTKMIDLAGTWNSSGANAALISLAVTKVGGSSTFSFIQCLGGASGTTAMFGVNSAGALTLAGGITCVGIDAGTNGYFQLGTRAYIDSPADAQIAFHNNANTQASILTIPVSATLQHGAADAASPVAQTLKFQGVVAGTSNTAGANATIAGSVGTGTGAGGSLIFQTAPAGSTGTSQNALTTRLTINGAGSVVAGSAAIATSATDGFLYIPSCAGTPTGVPTTFTGRVPMVYDTTNHKFYIYDGSWLGGTAPGVFS